MHAQKRPGERFLPPDGEPRLDPVHVTLLVHSTADRLFRPTLAQLADQMVGRVFSHARSATREVTVETNASYNSCLLTVSDRGMELFKKVHGYSSSTAEEWKIERCFARQAQGEYALLLRETDKHSPTPFLGSKHTIRFTESGRGVRYDI